MHLFPEFVCDFDSLIESDSEVAKEREEDSGSDIEIDFDIASSSPIQLDRVQQGLEDDRTRGGPEYLKASQTVLRENDLVGDGDVYAPCYSYQNSVLEDDGLELIDIDIFDDDGKHAYGLDEDDGFDADVSSQPDILEADADMEDFTMDIDTASSVSSAAELQDEAQDEAEAEEADEIEEEEEGDVDSTTPPVIGHIEDMVLLFLKQLAMPGRADEDTDATDSSADSDACDDENDKPTNTNKAPKLKRTDYKIEIPLADRRKRGRDGNDSSMKVLSYPRKCQTGSAQSLAKLFRVLDLAHESTLNGVPATKRDIYYRDVSLFKSQRVVDELVDDIAATFDVDRSDLSIRSSSKGIVCSSGLSIELLSGETITCKDTEGSLIPAGEDIASFSIDEDISWVLVVEKEAIFQTLCRMKVARDDNMPGPGIIITGKGYPDIASRHLVKSLADALPKSIPVVALVDGDPYGLDILSVYKYGSQKMRHEEGKLAARRIKWLGLWASELQSLGIGKEHLLPINRHDEKKALAILARRDISLPGRWKKEMQYMLHNRRKAEIEILSTKVSDEGLKSPLQGASGSGQFISSSTNLDTSPVAESNSAQTYAPDRDAAPLSIHSPTALLMRYLSTKIADVITQKVAREAGRGSVAL